MAVLPVSLLLGQSQFKVYNNRLKIDVMAKVKVIRVKIRLAANPMRHMREDGTTISDTRIIMPFTVEAEIICPDLNVASDVLNVMKDRGSLYRVTSKGLIFDDMMLLADSMHQTPENLSSTPTTIVFQQMLLQGTQLPITTQPADSSVMDRGIATLRETVQGAAQSVTDLFNRATEAIGRAGNQ